MQSAVLRSHVVCLSVCLSVTLVDCDRIGWNSSKIISPLVSLGCSLFATISPQRLTIYLYIAHRAVIFAIAQISCSMIHPCGRQCRTEGSDLCSTACFPLSIEHVVFSFFFGMLRVLVVFGLNATLICLLIIIIIITWQSRARNYHITVSSICCLQSIYAGLYWFVAFFYKNTLNITLLS